MWANGPGGLLVAVPGYGTFPLPALLMRLHAEVSPAVREVEGASVRVDLELTYSGAAYIMGLRIRNGRLDEVGPPVPNADGKIAGSAPVCLPFLLGLSTIPDAIDHGLEVHGGLGVLSVVGHCFDFTGDEKGIDSPIWNAILAAADG